MWKPLSVVAPITNKQNVLKLTIFECALIVDLRMLFYYQLQISGLLRTAKSTKNFFGVSGV